MDDTTANAPAQRASAAREVNFVFTGRTWEYFKIWVVNVCLTVVTLGIYSAWAKVRTRRYFYRNVLLEGQAFDYHAKPTTILKGRLIATAVLGGVYAVFWFHKIAGSVLFGVLFLLMPLIVNQASRFNARMTSYRNVRFAFAGSYGRAFLAFCVWPIVGVATFGLLFPLAMQRRNAYMIKNHSFGTTPFAGRPSVGAFYLACLQAVGLGVASFVFAFAVAAVLLIPTFLKTPGAPPPMLGSLFTSYMNMAILFFFVGAFVHAKLRNAVIEALALADHRFRSRLSGWRYGAIVFSNMLLTIVTAGLLYPWGQIRLARYVAARTAMIAASDLSEFASGTAAEGSVTAGEMAVLEGLAIGIGT